MADTALFSPTRLGALDLPHRVVMAPLTRSRSQQPGNIPHALNAEYYAQRASAGLIITEATQISQQAQGYAWTPGIHAEDQVAGWRQVTQAVHAKGGRIVNQLWHVGRVSHPSFQPGGGLPVAPSAIAPSGQAFIEGEDGQGGFADFVTPKPLSVEGVGAIVKDYAQAAENAKAAGFDGVELHAANGYLLNQFLDVAANQRADLYGGSVENRARFLLEALDAILAVWGPGRVGVRLSPLSTFMDMSPEGCPETYAYIAEQLSARPLAYLHLVEPEIKGDSTLAEDKPDRAILLDIRKRFAGPVILAGGYDKAKAETALARGDADAIAFGRLFLANPDLPERLRADAPLNTPNRATFYGGGAEGYTDYPALNDD
ncbi:MAG: alkene reductase [Maricaulaceae bacterium]